MWDDEGKMLLFGMTREEFESLLGERGLLIDVSKSD
jgi:hypothetical protein